MSDPMHDRLVQLESNLSHLERLYEQLNEVVVDQGKQLSRLQAQLGQAMVVLEAQELERVKSTNAKPPHYQ